MFKIAAQSTGIHKIGIWLHSLNGSLLLVDNLKAYYWFSEHVLLAKHV